MKKILLVSTCLFYYYFLPAQNVGIGTTSPGALLHIYNSSTDEFVRVQGNNPYIGFRNLAGTLKTYVQGFGDDLLVGTAFGNPTGRVMFYNNNVVNMTILPNGNVGIGVPVPLGTLDVMRGTALNGTALFRGTTHASSFNFGTNEDTYIRGGKNGSHVIINDGTMGNVGIGTTTPGAPLSFPNLIGNKISFWRNGTNNDFGIGINSGVMQFYTAGQDKIAFGWGNANPGAFNETITFYTGSGRIGLGTTTPATRLHIAQDNEALRLSGNQSYISFYNGNDMKGYLSQSANNIVLGTNGNNNGELYLAKNGVPALTVQSDGRVRVGALSSTIPIFAGVLPTFTVTDFLAFKTSFDPVGEWAMYGGGGTDLYFYYNGGFKGRISNVDGAYIPLSDSRLKEDFKIYKSVLDGIKKLDILTYHYKADQTNTRSFGLIAQNVKQYFPELVSGSSTGKDRYLGIDYGKTGVLAIKAIQEQQEIIEAQQKKIQTLEKRLSALENKVLNH